MATTAALNNKPSLTRTTHLNLQDELSKYQSWSQMKQSKRTLKPMMKTTIWNLRSENRPTSGSPPMENNCSSSQLQDILRNRQEENRRRREIDRRVWDYKYDKSDKGRERRRRYYANNKETLRARAKLRNDARKDALYLEFLNCK